MAKTNDSIDKISDALKLLDEAAAEKRDDIANLISEKYHNLRDSIHDIEPAIKRATTNVLSFAADAKEMGEQKVAEAVQKLDKDAHKNPWSYVAAAGVGGLVVGLLFSRRS